MAVTFEDMCIGEWSGSTQIIPSFFNGAKEATPPIFLSANVNHGLFITKPIRPVTLSLIKYYGIERSQKSMSVWLKSGQLPHTA